MLFLLAACGSATSEQQQSGIEVSTSDSNTQISEADPDSLVSEYEQYYVVVVDTGLDYYSLHKKMFEIHSRLNISIDTMGRYYNRKKDLIALPDDDEDEMYAGTYFHRRFPSENLSLEYLQSYNHESNEKTIALVSGIFNSEHDADSALSAVQQFNKNSFKIKANIYIGCIH